MQHAISGGNRCKFISNFLYRTRISLKFSNFISLRTILWINKKKKKVMKTSRDTFTQPDWQNMDMCIWMTFEFYLYLTGFNSDQHHTFRVCVCSCLTVHLLLPLTWEMGIAFAPITLHLRFWPASAFTPVSLTGDRNSWLPTEPPWNSQPPRLPLSNPKGHGSKYHGQCCMCINT